MKIPPDDILRNSFVVSIDNERFLAFQNAFESCQIIPKKFKGYEITDEYLLAHVMSLMVIKNKHKKWMLENDLKLSKSFANNASHFAIVQFAKMLDWPFVTIFEDDAVPVENIREKLDYYCSDIPDETDILRLGYCEPCFRPTRKSDVENAIPHSDKFIVKNISGSHAYIVFKRHYDRFLETNKDNPRCDFDKINPSPDKNVFALKESLFNQINLKHRPVIHSYKRADVKESHIVT